MSSASIHESVAGSHASLKSKQHLKLFGVFDNSANKDGMLTETWLSFLKRKDEGLAGQLMGSEGGLWESVANYIVSWAIMVLYCFVCELRSLGKLSNRK